jgi:mannose-6-phosphate isomerase-like protein (cupin superfamily)
MPKFDALTNGQAKGAMEAPAREPTEAKVIRYVKPSLEKPKHVVMFCRTSSMFTAVQVLAPGGGENKLHSHANMDGFWFVLRGRVRFYTTDDEVVGDLGPEEGILLPHGYPYWFENVGDGELELLQFESMLKAGERMQRTLHAAEELEVNFDITTA